MLTATMVPLHGDSGTCLQARADVSFSGIVPPSSVSKCFGGNDLWQRAAGGVKARRLGNIFDTAREPAEGRGISTLYVRRYDCWMPRSALADFSHAAGHALENMSSH